MKFQIRRNSAMASTNVAALCAFRRDIRGGQPVAKALRQSAHGVISRTIDPQVLVDTLLRSTRDHGAPIAPPVIWEQPGAPRLLTPHLPERERQVLRLIACGLTNTETGRTLHLSP